MNINNIATPLSFLFLVSELVLLLLKRSKPAEVKIRQDKLSLIILWVVISLSMFTGISLARRFPVATPMPAVIWAGFAVFLIGLFIRWMAIYQLGKVFTVDVAVSSAQKIKDDGLYKTIRHPSYLGVIMEFVGISFMLSNWYAIPVILIPILCAFAYRIKIEEKLLGEIFGPEYTNYKKRTKRIIPYIW